MSCEGRPEPNPKPIIFSKKNELKSFIIFGEFEPFFNLYEIETEGRRKLF